MKNLHTLKLKFLNFAPGWLMNNSNMKMRSNRLSLSMHLWQMSFKTVGCAGNWSTRCMRGALLRLFLPFPFSRTYLGPSLPNPHSHFPFRQPRHLPSTITLRFFITCRRGSPSSLSRTLTHYAYLLIFLSPISCTILRPVVAGLSQALRVFNLS